MPYAPNTIEIVMAFASRSADSSRQPPALDGQPTLKQQKGHRESDAPVVDGVVRVMRAVAAGEN